MPTASAPVLQNKKHIPALDGLRGTAILLVITFHYFGTNPVFALNWTSLDLFFVLSGFLITQRLTVHQDNPNRYSIFYWNRALRIIPLYWFTLILYFFAIHFLVSDQNLPRFDYYNRYWHWFFLFFHNWLFIFKSMPIEIHIVHLWSLAVEEQFYLIWPSIFFLFSPRKYFPQFLIGAIAVILVSRCIYYLSVPEISPSYAVYYNTFFRMDSFLAGCILNVCINRQINISGTIKKLAILCIIALFAGLVITGSTKHTAPMFVTYGYTALAILYAGVVYIAVMKPGNVLTRILNIRFLTETGKISYGMFMFHWPVFIVLNLALRKNKFITAFPTSLQLYVIGIICILITYIISYISFYYFESFFLKKKK